MKGSVSIGLLSILPGFVDSPFGRFVEVLGYVAVCGEVQYAL